MNRGIEVKMDPYRLSQFSAWEINEDKTKTELSVSNTMELQAMILDHKDDDFHVFLYGGPHCADILDANEFIRKANSGLIAKSSGEQGYEAYFVQEPSDHSVKGTLVVIPHDSQNEPFVLVGIDKRMLDSINVAERPTFEILDYYCSGYSPFGGQINGFGYVKGLDSEKVASYVNDINNGIIVRHEGKDGYVIAQSQENNGNCYVFTPTDKDNLDKAIIMSVNPTRTGGVIEGGRVLPSEIQDPSPSFDVMSERFRLFASGYGPCAYGSNQAKQIASKVLDAIESKDVKLENIVDSVLAESKEKDSAATTEKDLGEDR